MNKEIRIGKRIISESSPAFIVAELSANHNQDYHRAVEILHAAAEAGADAIKLQTYTADSMTIDSVLGTIAGDDTIFVLCRTEDAAMTFTNKMRAMLNA